MRRRTRRHNAALPITVVGTIGACDREPGGASDETAAMPTAASLGDQPETSVAGYLAAEPYRSADLDNGARQAGTCRACNTLEDGGGDRIGPNLHGVVGRAAGARSAFDYSPALQQAAFVWTPRALTAWLAGPGRFLPGNRMSFAGVAEPADRADLVAYLLKETSAQ